jgi:hypothetical protein
MFLKISLSHEILFKDKQTLRGAQRETRQQLCINSELGVGKKKLQSEYYPAIYGPLCLEYENLSFRFNETGEDFKFPACIHIDGVMATRRERQ